jgi:dolichol kinase
MKFTIPLSVPAALMLAASLACRPVFAIGWTELAIIFVIILVLFAPVLFRLFRFFTRNQETTDKNTDQHDA